jgi:hypothetical protein
MKNHASRTGLGVLRHGGVGGQDAMPSTVHGTRKRNLLANQVSCFFSLRASVSKEVLPFQTSIP